MSRGASNCLVVGLLLLQTGTTGCGPAEKCEGSSCSSPDAAASDAGPIDAASQFKTYHYVLVLDRESTDTSGMELDAIALIKGGQTFYADSFSECIQGPGIENATTTRDCNQSLGPPNNEAGECTGSDTFFVNLGGLGGSIVVSFADLTEIETGDSIRVYECGSVPDSYQVLVGTGTTVTDANWVSCSMNAAGVSECTVPELPQVPVE